MLHNEKLKGRSKKILKKQKLMHFLIIENYLDCQKNILTASMAEQLTCVPHVREVWSSNPGLAKSYTALQTVRHSFNIYASSCVALVL